MPGRFPDSCRLRPMIRFCAENCSSVRSMALEAESGRRWKRIFSLSIRDSVITPQ